MMTSEHMMLASEVTETERLLADIPKEFVIGRKSLESRLEELKAELGRYPLAYREPARARLTFGGRPVTRTHGIQADFGAAAVSKFSEVVANHAGSLRAPLPSRGRIPDRNEYRLLITGTARGSFGFELEEDLSQTEVPESDNSNIATAILDLQRFMESALSGNDDELAERLSEVDPRTVNSVREYLKLVASNNAHFALEFRNHAVRFSDSGQVRKCLSRLEVDTHEEHVDREGMFVGALPEHRRFEFQEDESGSTLSGKIAPSIEDVAAINSILYQPGAARFRKNWVGSGKPSYTLICIIASQEGE